MFIGTGAARDVEGIARKLLIANKNAIERRPLERRPHWKQVRWYKLYVRTSITNFNVDSKRVGRYTGNKEPTVSAACACRLFARPRSWFTGKWTGSVYAGIVARPDDDITMSQVKN